MSRETALVKNTFILSIGTVLPKLAAFVTLPVLTACLSKKQYGAYDLVTILVMLVMPVLTLQIHTAAFRFLIEHHNDRDLAKLYLSNIMAFVVPVGVLAVIITFCFLPVQDIVLRLCICAYLFVDILVSEIRQVTRGMARNLDYSISSIISAVTKMVLAVVLVWCLKYELRGAVIALTMGPTLSLLFLTFKIKVYELIDFKLFSKDILKEMLSYSWPMVPNNMAGWVIRASDRLVVTSFLGLPANAALAVAHKLPNLLLMAQGTFNMSWQENASIASKDGDAGAYYSKMFTTMANFYAGCLVLIVAATPLLFRLLIRGNYPEAYPQMPILFSASFCSCMSGFLGGIYIACKATKSVGISTVMAAACNLVVDLALIKVIGIYAATLSTLVSFFFLLTYRMFDVRKHANIHFDLPRFALAVVAMLVGYALFYLNKPVFNLINGGYGVAAFCLLNRPMIVSVVGKVKARIFKKS